jgi:hypothetical protein
MWSTLSKIFSITVILDETLEPQNSSYWFSLFFNTLFKLSISLANNPKHFAVGKIVQ